MIKEGSISAAAKFLHLTQTTLSRQLMQLEKQLGVTLFDRGHKQIELASYGFLLKRRADSVAVGKLVKVMIEFCR